MSRQVLRAYEREITADYVAKLAEEKDREREERERLREERRAQQEIERERARLEKERQHYLNALQALRANGDAAAIEGLEGGTHGNRASDRTRRLPRRQHQRIAVAADNLRDIH